MTPADSIAPTPYQPAIAPCPFGCPLPLALCRRKSSVGYEWVQCGVCGTEGPKARSWEDAVARWNVAAEPEAALVATFAALRDVLTARRVGSLLPESASRILLEAVAETVTSPLVYKRIAAAIGEAWEDAECES